jgi:DNA-directed RNA polymerase specialized sigma24 family protein
MSEADLAQRAIAGESEAVAALWRTHRRWVGAVLLAHRPRGVDLEDLLQEVAVIVLQKIAELRDPERLRPWLAAIARNVARMEGRVGHRTQKRFNFPPSARRRAGILPVDG